MEMKDSNRQNKREKPIFLRVLITTLIVIISFVGGFFSHYIFQSPHQALTNELLSILEQVGYVIDPVTGERKEITSEDVADALVNGLLDRYSAYYTPEEYAKITAEGNGEYEGVGLSFYNSNPVVSRIIGNSPAEKAGFLVGDLIVCASQDEGESKAFSSSVEFTSYLKECDSSLEITVTILRNGENINLSFKKSKYAVSYATYYDSEMKYYFQSKEADGELESKQIEDKTMAHLSADTAYVSFTQFEGDAAEQLECALDFMKGRGRSKLILDLRDNGGGYMDILTKVAAMLVYNGGQGNFLVAYADAKTGGISFNTSAYNYKDHIDEIVVLANENTASASECLIGCLASYGENFSLNNLVTIKNSKGIGRTYGKGIMQTTYQLISGGAFKLTTARVLWPDKKTCIHGVGIIPPEANQTTNDNAINRALDILSR